MVERPGSEADAAAPHVLFLGHGAERTGPPILLGHLLPGLIAGGLRGSVVTARGGPLLAVYRAAGADARAVAPGREPFEPLAAAGRRLGAAGLVERLQDRRRAQVVHRGDPADLVYVNAATPPTAALLRALDPAPSTPVLLHVHELDVGLRLTLDERDRRLLFDRADRVVAASEPVRSLLIDGHGIDPARITTCPEFVDVAAVRPIDRAAARCVLGVPEDAMVVGAVGLPDWRKDPEALLHAARTIDRPPWVVWIGGDPASVDGRHLADEARRVGLADRFVHHPHVDRPDELLSALDLFVLPSREDALPLAALEAAAAGLPIVCFRTGGAADLAGAGAGIAVPYPDVVALGTAIAELLDDPDRRTAVGRSAHRIVADDHDVAIGTTRIRAVLDRLIG